MEKRELIDSIMEMIEAKMLTANTKAKYSVEPFQLTVEPKGLMLNKTVPKTRANTKHKMFPPLTATKNRGTRCHGHPSPPTGPTVVFPSPFGLIWWGKSLNNSFFLS